jgi:hypothetical protein
MALDEGQLARDIAAAVQEARSAGGRSPMAIALPAGEDFCSIWPKAKPVLELISGVVVLIPGAGTTAGAVLQALIKVGDQISSEVCGAHVAPAALGVTGPVAGGAITLQQGKRYRATVALSGIEQLASNAMIAARLVQIGFKEVVVTGSGGSRQVQGVWTGPDTTAQGDAHISGIVEVN